MSGATIGAVVRCGDLVGGVYDSVASLRLGAVGANAIAIVAERTTPRSADTWLSAFAARHGAQFVRSGTAGPGGSWNAGLTALPSSDYAICLESGDMLDRSALQALVRVARTDPAIAVVTTGVEWVGPASRRSFVDAAVSGAADLLADPHAAHVSSLFRRSRWTAECRFDETMPDLEFTDFWLQLLVRGGRMASVAEPLLRRRMHERALYRRTWGTADHRSALKTLYERHWEIVRAAPGELLEAKERASLREHFRHQEMLAVLDAVERDRERQGRALRAALEAVPDSWESTPDFGVFARTSPLSHDWGYDRGTPADRPMIERYLAAYCDDIRGVVLEIQEDDYTRRFGGTRVERNDVLDLDVGNPRATVIGDLREVPHIAADSYDCIILTQTLHVIDDMGAVVRECARLLKPGGVLLATLPSASRVCLEYGPEADFWRVTEAGARRLFGQAFPAASISSAAIGNPLVNLAFGFGLASEELPAGSQDTNDPYFPTLIGVRAEKPRAPDRPGPAWRRVPDRRGVVVLYHRVGAQGPDPHRLSVTDAAFRLQLEWLRATCSVVSLETLCSGGGSGPPDRAVAITFDDGYVEAVTTAMPLLEAAGLPATFFLTTAEGPDPFHYWWDRLAGAMLGPSSLPASLTLEVPSARQALDTRTAEARAEAHRLVYHEVVRLPTDSRDAIVSQVVAWAGGHGLREEDRRLTWDEAISLSSAPGVTIGAHTVDHLHLPAQPDAVIRHQLVESRATLERVIGRPVDRLAYPFGAHDGRAVQAARHAGFRTALTCVDRAVTPLDDPLALPRVEALEGSLDRFVASVERAFRGVR